MAKFIYLYRGPTPELTPEQLAKHDAWIQTLGAALVDIGGASGQGSSVHDDGREEPLDGLFGYSILEAVDLAAAKAFTEGKQFLSSRDGQRSVEIYERLQME